MSSSKGSNVYDDVDPMELVSDDEFVSEVQVITSDSESAFDGDIDDFQLFALLDDIIKDDGEHVVEVIPFDVIPLDAIPFVVDLDDDDDIIPVILVDHADADLGDGEVFDLVILHAASPVISVVGLQRYPDFGDDIMPAEPVILAPIPSLTPPHAPVHAPTDEPTQAPITTRHPDEAGPSGHAHIPPGETDLYYPPHVPVEHLATQNSPPHASLLQTRTIHLTIHASLLMTLSSLYSFRSTYFLADSMSCSSLLTPDLHPHRFIHHYMLHHHLSYHQLIYVLVY
ncbi:hypothetical protein Hanom_Chr06g00534601 [Helianthus anomalus]